ncbi:Undecaprenyl-phosphate galactose phosphotransferase, WbaP/exopolysaccharide biosynthesis polyprenyl glycosylphosphotransferase [Citricoccus sp. K5]|nr:Undecaprenyl-phosphate galactose phosphotransferase, WbaP/exopolysaccharide biosynthesis polyprenyl glycosylphosphotransferase [Citricoccus sp. K5]
MPAAVLEHTESGRAVARNRPWTIRVVSRMGVVDAVAITASVACAQTLRFGLSAGAEIQGAWDASYVSFSIFVGIAWWMFLSFFKSRDLKILGAGPDEYKRVAMASLYLFGLIAIISYVFQLDLARGYVGIALPLGIVALLIGRWVLRRQLVRERTSGRSIRRVVLLGGPSAVQHLHRSLSGVPGAGYKPVASILPGYSLTGPEGEEGLSLPVASVSQSIPEILRVLEDYDADALAISAGAPLKTRTVRQLGWELAERRISQIMAPALTDIAGPRIHAQPVAGLSLIHVSTPRLAGPEAFLKRSFDILASGVGLLLMSPFLLAFALAVKIDDPGPAFFHQERVGKNGERFHMHKFRSMVVDAEARLAKLQEQNEGAGVLFKMKDDPRITKFGAFIRRYSIDELPQLWNVFVGDMSLVGPRPPLPAEVEDYEQHVSRRLLVKPGITGLWQVSGRSDLSWDESVRLDLYYVENWSFLQDLLILGRTAKAVIGKDGAY